MAKEAAAGPVWEGDTKLIARDRREKGSHKWYTGGKVREPMAETAGVSLPFLLIGFPTAHWQIQSIQTDAYSFASCLSQIIVGRLLLDLCSLSL